MTDAGLEARLYLASTVLARRPQPDWPAIHRELKRKGVALQLVWEEHRAGHAQGYGYSRFCELYRAWEGRLSPTMRQTHVGGEKLFVDYAGTTMEVIDGATGEAIKVQLFVAVLGASSHTWAEATWTQTLAETKADAEVAFDTFIESYKAKYEKAADCLEKDRGTLLAFYGFPAEHWKHLRTTNPIESTFTVRHRTIRTKGCPSNKTALAMVLKLVEGAQKSSRRAGWSHPVADFHPWCDIRRRARGDRKADRPSAQHRRRLTDQAITKNWR